MYIKSKNKVQLFLNIAMRAGLILVFCLSVAGAQPAHAQDPNTQPAAEGKVATGTGPASQPGDALDQAGTSPVPMPAKAPAGAVLAADGTWFMPAGANPGMAADRAAPLSGLNAPASTGGPDEFGYIWNDSMPLNWVDTTSGTNTGLSGSSWSQAVGPVSLPFSFKYYEYYYNSLYIAASGYVSFTDNAGNWDWQSDIPDPYLPNNVIAPYWSPLNIGSGGWVHYLSGGSAPNRFFAVEWHNVTDNYGGNPFVFEVVLWESGNVLFQYQTMTYSGGWSCGAAGIENSIGEDGLNTLGFCDQATSYKAVLFTRPAPAARIQIHPADQGQFTGAGAQIPFSVPVHNYGDLGTDKYNLDFSSSSWTAALFAADGVTPLTDTDGNGKPDTGAVSQGATATVVVKVTTPSGVLPGDSNTVTLNATSALNPSVSKTLTMKTAIPVPFAQQFRDVSTGGIGLDLVQSHGQSAELADKYNWFYDPAIARTAGGNYIYAGTEWGYTHNRSHYDIMYTLLDRAGNVIKPVTDLTNNTGIVYDSQPAVAATPDGRIGFLWIRRIYSSDWSLSNFNVFFAIMMDGSGKKVLAPTNITNNTAWGGYGALGVPTFSNPHLAATDDNRFILTWQTDLPDSGGTAQDIYYGVKSSAGGLVHGNTKLTAAISGSINYIEPKLASLTSNRAFLSWMQRQNGNDNLLYAILASDGSVVKGQTNLSASDGFVDWWNDDAVQLPNGNLLAVWESWGCFPGEWADRIIYALLDASYNPIGTPKCLDKSFPASQADAAASITVSGSNYGVVTWNDSQSKHLNYALMDVNGNIITQPMIFLSPKNSWQSIYASYLGYGNAPYDPYSPLANDDFNSPTIITSLPYTLAESTALATSASDDPQAPDCGLGPGLASVWFQFTPATDMTFYVDTLGSSYDTILAVWSGTRGALSPVACNNDSGGTLQSVVRTALTAGTPYSIEAAQYNGNFVANQNTELVNPMMVGGVLKINASQIPSPEFPADGESLNANLPTFDWSDVSGATGYTIQIGKTPDFKKLATKGTAAVSSFTPKKDLPAGMTLYWRVAASYGKTLGPWSATNTFLTAIPPSTPVLVSPAKNATVSGYTPLLVWKVSKLPAGTTFAYYQVQVATTADFSSPLVDDTSSAVLAVPNFTTPTLPAATTFYWRVRASNLVGGVNNFSDWSAVRSFKTR